MSIKYLLLSLYSFTLTLVLSQLFPYLRLFPILAFLSIMLTRSSLQNTVWISFIVGFLLDCLQSSLPIGSFTLITVVCSLLLYRQKWLIVHDNIFSTSIFTMLYATLFLLGQLCLSSIFNQKILLTFYSFFTDYILLTICDGALALIGFTLPELLIKKMRKLGSFRFIFKKSLN